MAPRPCSECGQPLPEGSPKSRKTCSARCRSARARRKGRARKRESTRANLAQQDPDKALREEFYPQVDEDLVARITEEELRPYVREQITEDTINAIGGLMKLTPRMVAVVGADLTHPDPQIRHKAAALVARYTMGDKLVPGAPEDKTVKVVLDTPSPFAQHGDTVTLESDEPEELRECERCHQDKPESAFEAGAPRCNECQAALRLELEPPSD